MMKNTILLVSILGLGLAACGDNLSGLRPDAREQIDGTPGPDSPPGTPDADLTPDADTGTSTVTVTAGACTPGPGLHTLVAASLMWEFDTDAPAADKDITIAAGDRIEFTTAGSHNFASVATTGALSFRSGPVGAHVACLTFTAAGGPADFHCEMHATMTGTITVTP
jgi:plastocyanin